MRPGEWKTASRVRSTISAGRRAVRRAVALPGASDRFYADGCPGGG
ncbi:MAG TPA: hypothetical protein VOA80_13410 [Thermoanaerobaculia bacterium]|nr:hypothetical protein [Thermoanaerobaculia bacterium]